jgi:hypothetical protein
MDVKEVSPSKASLVAGLLDSFLSVIVRWANEHFTGRYSRLRVTAIAFLLSVLTTLPLYQFIPQGFSSVTGQVWSWKLAHPLSPIPNNLKNPALYEIADVAGQASHADKMELRLFLPILGRLTGTGLWTVVVWNHIAGLGTFYLLAVLASEALMDSVGGALFVVGLAPTFFGSWFFNDSLIGDGVAYFLMLLSVAWRSPLLSALSFLAAAFCDERCLTAMPLLLCYIALRFPGPAGQWQRTRSSIAFVSAALIWASLRWWLVSSFGLSTGTSLLATGGVLRQQLTESLPYSLFDVFRASWLPVGFALLSLIAVRRWQFAAVWSACISVAILPAFVVWDFKRSVAYAFVVLLISLYFLRGEQAALRKCLAAILVINVLLFSPGKSVLRALAWL